MHPQDGRIAGVSHVMWTGAPRDKVLESLQRKANILAELYEMSKALGSGFDLDKIFKMATDIIFRSTPADRVIALLAEGLVTEENADDARPHHYTQSNEGPRGAAVTGCRRGRAIRGR